MSAVDVEGLFRKFTVGEVRDIEKKVKTDIERKKEDLRQMVGRRYRDIIEAADSIRDMKNRAEDILGSIQDVHSGFDRLQLLQQQLITAQQRAHLSTHVPVDPDFAIETQLKLFQDIPELRCGSLLSSISWRENVGANREVSNCLCALMFLESLSSTEVLDKFLVAQKNKLEEVFYDSDCSSREQICACVAIVQWTVLMVHSNFSLSEGNRSSLTEKMDAISGGTWLPESYSKYLSQQSRVFNLSLSVDIRSFHPVLPRPVLDLEKSVLQEAASSWMQECLDFSRENLGNSLVYFESIETLTMLKKAILETLSSAEADDWMLACRKTLSSDLSLWDALVKDLLDRRLQELVTLRVDAEFAKMARELAAEDDTKRKSLMDFARYLWKELPTDTPRISDQTSVSTLTLKARGVIPAVYLVCRKLDDCLRELQVSLENHYDVSSGVDLSHERKRRRICSISGDFPEIWKCLADSCMKSVTQFVGDIEKRIAGFEKDASSLDGVQSLIRDAQVCQCFCELCPSMKTCLAYQSHLDYKGSEEAKSGRRSQETELWKAAKSLLSSATVKACGIWTKATVDEAQRLFLNGESQALSVWLEGAQDWETVSIEEESETGEKVTSKLQVPLQCSRHFHQFLSYLAASVNSLGPHRFPKSAMAVFVQSSLLAVVKSVQQILRMCNAESKKLSQKQAIQVLFDLKVVAGILVSKSANPEEQAILNRQIAELTEKLHSFIDPFDLDVLSPHIKRNVTKFQHKFLSLYGVIILPETASNLSRSPAAKPVAGSEQPQILPLASGINRFQLLPVATPSKTELLPHGSTKPVVHLHAAMSTANVDEMERKRKGRTEDFSKSSSSAALSSIYDKISTGWFGM